MKPIPPVTISSEMTASSNGFRLKSSKLFGKGEKPALQNADIE